MKNCAQPNATIRDIGVPSARLSQNPDFAAAFDGWPLRGVEILLWCLLYAILVAGLSYRVGGPRLSNDSYQYLSEAENIAEGHGLSTSIAHFDTERSSGRLPTPLTTFPPGYPLAIAALAKMGLASETAGLIISIASFTVLVPLVVWAASLLALSSVATRIVLVLLLGNATATWYATFVTTETLFVALSFGALVCLLWYERGGRSAPAIGNLLVGCAYWVRYAGLFLFVTVAVYLAWGAYNRRDRRSLTALSCLALPATMIGLLMFRNTMVTGTWKGRDMRVIDPSSATVLKQFCASTYHLFFGQEMATRLNPLQVTLGLGLILLIIMLGRGAADSAIRSALSSPFPRARLLLTYVAIYNTALIYLGWVHVIGLDTRFFYPLLAVYLVLFGLMFTRLWTSASARSAPLAWTTCALIIGASYLGMNLEDPMAQRWHSPHVAVQESFADTNLRSWFDAHVPDDAVIVATNGQATSYALKRRTVSLVSTHYSDQHWGEDEVHAVMRRYKADFLIVYPGLDPNVDPVQEDSKFLQALAAGYRPQWLELAVEGSGVLIFRRSA